MQCLCQKENFLVQISVSTDFRAIKNNALSFWDKTLLGR